MLKKLKIDSLSAEISTLNELLSSAKESDDIVGIVQLEYRIKELLSELSLKDKTTFDDNRASVALFFGGQPVFGSKGISLGFAGIILDKFQNLINKIYFDKEVNHLGKIGKPPLEEDSKLMVTGLARGSFGFVLNEINEQVQLESSGLSYVINKAACFIRDSASQDYSDFDSMLKELEPITILALRDIFLELESSKSTIRVVEKELDFTLDSISIHRAKERMESTDIRESTMEVEGILKGFLPEHRKFELSDNSGNLFYGTVTSKAVKQFTESTSIINSKCLIKMATKTVYTFDKPGKETVRLIEFL